jgi:hypothetical protein
MAGPYADVYDALPDLFDLLGLSARFSNGLTEGEPPVNTPLPTAYYEPTTEPVTTRTNRSKYKAPLVTIRIADRSFGRVKGHKNAIENALKQTAGVELTNGQVLYARLGTVTYVPEVGFVKAAVELEFMTVGPL